MLNLQTLVNELKAISDWHSLGVHLGLSHQKLSEIEQNYPNDVSRRKSEVFIAWLEVDPNCSWKKMYNALQRMDKRVEAERIKQKYMQSDTKGPSPTPNSHTNAIVVASKIIESIDRISLELGQADISQQVRQILQQLQSGNVKVGVIGLTNAGKSTTLNALMGKGFLPASFQPQTVATVCITNDEHSPGELLGKKSADGEFARLAFGLHDVRKHISDLNNKDRSSNCQQYAQLCLSAPIECLKGKSDMKLEIYDTPGTSESDRSSATVTAIGAKALNEMAAFVLILSAQSLFERTQTELLEQIQHLRPLLMQRCQRILVLVNKFDICYDGNTESLTPSKLKEKVASLIKVSDNHIINFSAKWALEAREWQRGERVVSEDDYGTVYYFLRKTPKKESVNGMKENSPDNVKKLAKCLEDFSQIKTVESYLLDMLYTNGPAILLESAVDAVLHIISTQLLSTIAQKVSAENIPAKKQNVATQTNLITRVNDVIENSCKQKILKQFPAKASADFLTHRDAIASGLESTIMSRLSSKVPQLRTDFNNQGSASSLVINLKKEIVTAASQEVKQAWLKGVTTMKGRMHQLLQITLDQLEAELTSTNSSKHISFKGINAGNIVNEIVATESPTIPDCPAISDSTLNTLVTPHTITKQRLENREHRGGRRYGIAGPRHKHVYQVAVNYQVTVYRVKADDVQTKFTTFAKVCASHFNGKLAELVTNSSQTAYLQTSKVIDQVSVTPLKTLRGKLDTSKQTLQHSESEVARLEAKKKEIDEAANALRKLLPSL